RNERTLLRERRRRHQTDTQHAKSESIHQCSTRNVYDSGRPRSRVRRGNARHELGRWIQPRIEQMPRLDVAERLEHRALDAGMLALELHQQPFRALTLQSEIAARGTAAADDRQVALSRVRTRFVF